MWLLLKIETLIKWKRHFSSFLHSYKASLNAIHFFCERLRSFYNVRAMNFMFVYNMRHFPLQSKATAKRCETFASTTQAPSSWALPTIATSSCGTLRQVGCTGFRTHTSSSGPIEPSHRVGGGCQFPLQYSQFLFLKSDNYTDNLRLHQPDLLSEFHCYLAPLFPLLSAIQQGAEERKPFTLWKKVIWRLIIQIHDYPF